MVGMGGPELLILLILLLVLGAITAFLVARRTSKNKGRDAGGIGQEDRDARDILNERYARGDIDREDYLRMRQDIEG